MKAAKLILVLILTVIFIRSNAQELTYTFVGSLSDVNTIVLNDLSGDCTLFQSTTDELNVKSELYINGETWGWKLPDRRPVFNIYSRQSNDTLYIEMPYKFSFKVIGISTYSEQIKSVLQIPNDKQIIVRKAEKLSIEGEFNYLNIQNTTELYCNTIFKMNMNRISCKATERLTINGIRHNNLYEWEGQGNGNYNLQANHIFLTTK